MKSAQRTPRPRGRAAASGRLPGPADADAPRTDMCADPGMHADPAAHAPEMAAALAAWFAANSRDLPWRKRYTPYEVWISEIMLQQTQMERAVGYFRRWLARFPDLPSLAAAPEDEVLRLWEGLGYYSRARNLLAAARRVMTDHGGVLPQEPDALRALPGIGAYTAAAIASIAHGRRVACVDANVERVLARVFDIEGPVRREPAAGFIRARALALVPPGQARIHNQAMMELGALVCRKTPLCPACPWRPWCLALRRGTVQTRPVAAGQKRMTALSAVAGVLLAQGHVLVRRRPPGHASGRQEPWAGLWEFPGNILADGEDAARAAARSLTEAGIPGVRIVAELGRINHSRTRFRIALRAFLLGLDPEPPRAEPAPPARTHPEAACAPADARLPLPARPGEDWRWLRPADLAALAMPAPHRTLAELLLRPAQASLPLSGL